MSNKSTRIIAIVAVPILLIIGLIVLGLYFFLYPRLAHPSEETSRFLPITTRVYVAVNLRPGVRQLRHAIKIISAFQPAGPDLKESEERFPDQIKDNLAHFEDETGISIERDLFPWVGPEIAIGLIDVGAFTSDIPEVVAFIGTTDSQATETFVLKLLKYLDNQQDTDIAEHVVGDSTVYVISSPNSPADIHLAITEDYLVLTTNERTLLETTYMMAQPVPSLYDNPNFQQARQSVADPRFAMLYIDVEGLSRDAQKLQEASNIEFLETVQGSSPDFVAMSVSLADMGIRVTGSWETTPDTSSKGQNNRLSSTDILPSDTLALISATGVLDGWKQAKDHIGKAIEDVSGLIGATGLTDQDFNVGFDDLLKEIERETGVDVDNDIVAWMRAEVAFALLSTDIKSKGLSRAVEEGPIVDVLAIIELLDNADHGNAESGLDNIRDYLEEVGIDFDNDSIQGEKAVIADLQEDIGYEPGYLILEDHVLIGSTRSAFEQAFSVKAKTVDSLSGSKEFKNILKESTGTLTGLLYINVHDIVEQLAGSLSPSQRMAYQNNVAPFVQPINTFSIVSAVAEQHTSVTMLITLTAERKVEAGAEINPIPTSTPDIEAMVEARIRTLRGEQAVVKDAAVPAPPVRPAPAVAPEVVVKEVIVEKLVEVAVEKDIVVVKEVIKEVPVKVVVEVEVPVEEGNQPPEP